MKLIEYVIRTIVILKLSLFKTISVTRVHPTSILPTAHINSNGRHIAKHVTMHGHDLMDYRATGSKNVVKKKPPGTTVTPKNRKVTSRRNISNKNRKRAGGGHIKQGLRKTGGIRKSTLSKST